MDIPFILRQLYLGEGLGRALMNWQVQQTVKLGKVVLDIGSKGSPSYHQFLDQVNIDLLVSADIETDSTTDLGGSIVQLPFAEDSFDTVICLNVLEHVFDYSSALSELRRVLKPSGVLYGRVPFLIGVHQDPCDYWRYTKETLCEIASAAGFAQVLVETHGGLLLALYSLLDPIWRRIGLLKMPIALATLIGDQILRRVLPDTYCKRYPLGYFFRAQ